MPDRRKTPRETVVPTFDTIAPLREYFERKAMKIPNKTTLSKDEQEAMLRDIEECVLSFNLELERVSTIIASETKDLATTLEIIEKEVVFRNKKVSDILNLNKVNLKLK